MEKVWKEVSCCICYEMLIDGTVRNKKTKKVLKPFKIKAAGGYYYQYNLHIGNGKYITKCRHRLIAETFIPNPDNLPEVDHIIPVRNGGADVVENLRWVSTSGNQKNPLTIEHVKKQWNNEKRETVSKRMTGNAYGETLGIPVIQKDMNENIVFIWKSTREAERVGGFDHKSISNCCRGIKKSHHHYKWEYM